MKNMKKEINIRRDDILWRFYCKRFLVEGKEVEPPKNLCRYFWTSVKGFGLWLGREVKLRSLWLISLVVTAMVTAMFFALAFVIRDANNIVVTALVVVIDVLWSFAFSMAMIVTLYRMMRMVKARAPWVIYLLGFGSIVLVIIHMATQGTSWPEFTRHFDDLPQMMGCMLVAMVVVMITAFILSVIPHRHSQKLQRVFQTFGAFVSAKKNRVCPPVNPPEDFKVKP